MTHEIAQLIVAIAIISALAIIGNCLNTTQRMAVVKILGAALAAIISWYFRDL